MKKIFFLIAAGCLAISAPSAGQGFIKKVTKSVTDEILGTPKSSSAAQKEQPEPPCACSDATLVLDLGGQLKLDYKEISISMKDDGSLLVKDRMTSKYYVARNGRTTGPYDENSPEVLGFAPADRDDNSMNSLLSRYREYISKSGEKYAITFQGKSYGPYSQISNFAVTAPGDKFAAIVVENMPVTEDEGEKMEEAIKNAKTDQERMELSMKYAQVMQQKMMQGGGPSSVMPKLVTNVPGTTLDPMKSAGGILDGKARYGEIVMIAYDRIIDLQGKTVATLKQEAIGKTPLLISSGGNRYAWFSYGTLFFSDSSSLAELFNPYLTKSEGKAWLAYMYYSPRSNALMQCKIPF